MSATMIKAKAAYGEVVCCSAVKSGTVPRVSMPPKISMEVRRPILSDSAPTIGWMSIKTSNATVMTTLATFACMPVVLTRYFCI